MALTLSVPFAARNSPKEIETNPKKARAWVESLPLTKTVESVRQLVGAIEALNRAKIGVDERIELIEAYRSVTDVLLDELDATYAYCSLPLQAKQREAFDLAYQLLTECGYAYKMLLLEKTSRLIVFNPRKNLSQPLFRTMCVLRNLMMQAYKTYYPVPHGVWQELHTLYQYAEENGFTDEVVDADKKTSIADLYVECLMLWLADPYRLMHKEVERVTELLAQNRGLVDIRSNSEGVGSRSFFVVALDADQAPKMPVQGNVAPSGEILRLIDPARLVARLEAQVKAVGKVAVEKGRATHDLTDLLFRLITLWGDPPKRQFRRNATESSVALCSGIKAIAYFADLASKEDTDIEAQLIRNGGTMPLLRIPQDPVSQLVGVEEWQVLNQSAIGLRLHRESSGNVGITVGEIVGIRFAGGRTWNVGVVRWLTLLEGSALEFGIELISPTAHSITLQPTIGGGTKPIPALLLGAVAPESDSDTALTLSDTFSDLREFELDDHGKVTHVRATTLIERTSHFDLFQFQPS